MRAAAFALSTDSRARHVFAALLYGGATVYAIATLCRYPRWTVDDAYIVFRYARHLVEHGQLTWNVGPGAERVEGYTGIALPLLVAAGMRAGISPIRLTRALGIAFFFVGAWTLRDNQRRLGVPEPVRAYVTAGAMLFPPLFAHATSGLETIPFAAMLGVCFGLLLACDASPRPAAQARLWMALLLLALLRPEGVLFAAAFGAAVAWRVREARRGAWVASALAATLFVVPYGGYFVWRATYYGRLLPNTYYAKAAVHGFDPGFAEATLLLAGWLLPALVVGAALLVLTRRGALEGRRLASLRARRAPVLAALLAMACLGVQYSRSNLIMGYLFRFQMHTWFLLIPLLGAMLAPAARWRVLLGRCGPGKGTALAALMLGCLLAWPVESLGAESLTRARAERYLRTESEQHARVAAWLRDHLPASEKVACWIDAGIIPFTDDGRTFVDFGRLNDAYLTRPGLSRKQVADYFFAQRPGALVMTSDTAARLAPQHDGDIVTSDPRFATYERVAAYCSPEYRHAPCEIVFVRRGVALR